MKKLGIYIHIPFCMSKCFYCDFNSYANKLYLVDKYIECLIKEIYMHKEKMQEYIVDTIFIGGGTPSVIPQKHIYNILDNIYKLCKIEDNNEITIEANPKTLDASKLKVYKSTGINRISMGLQSCNDRLLKKIGRIHTAEDFFETYQLIKDVGFNNINADLMFNLPTQTLDDVISSIENIACLDIKHISFYSLKLEKGTIFYDKYYNDNKEMPDEDTEREMYHKGIEILNKYGYKHYEISNFAKEGFESKHNIKYWEVNPYLGIGLGSHSNMNKTRWNNYEKFQDYFQSMEKDISPIQDKEHIDKAMEMAEYAILGLRLKKGISKKNFKQRFGYELENVFGEKINKFEKQGLLKSKDRVFLTNKGIDLSNIVFMEFLP